MALAQAPVVPAVAEGVAAAASSATRAHAWGRASSVHRGRTWLPCMGTSIWNVRPGNSSKLMRATPDSSLTCATLRLCQPQCSLRAGTRDSKTRHLAAHRPFLLIEAVHPRQHQLLKPVVSTVERPLQQNACARLLCAQRFLFLLPLSRSCCFLVLLLLLHEIVPLCLCFDLLALLRGELLRVSSMSSDAFLPLPCARQSVSTLSCTPRPRGSLQTSKRRTCTCMRSWEQKKNACAPLFLTCVFVGHTRCAEQPQACDFAKLCMLQ